MAKFLDKKERVIDFQLTPYGKHRLSVGQLKPHSYAFFDTGIAYDIEYLGDKEIQTKIHERIKTETQFIEGILLFEEAENSTPTSIHAAIGFAPLLPGKEMEVFGTSTGRSFSLIEVLGGLGISGIEGYVSFVTTGGISDYFGAELEASPTRIVSMFDLDVIPQRYVPKPEKLSFESAIGDAKFEGDNTQAAPAWKIVTCQGEMSNIRERDTTNYNYTAASFDEEMTEFNIPQIDVAAYYTLLVDKATPLLGEEKVSDFITETQTFADQNVIRLVSDDIVVYADEINTELLTENFDIQVFEMTEETKLERLATGRLVTSLLTVGNTITIRDGKEVVTFKIINNNPAGLAAAQAEFDESGIIGVVASSAYKLNGVAAKNRFGTIYNLMSAINGDNGTTALGYPTDPHNGSNADGTPIPPAGATQVGRCKTIFGSTCHVGGHNLDVTIGTAVIEAMISHDFDGGSEPYDIEITNNRSTTDNPPVNPNVLWTISSATTTGTGFSDGVAMSGIQLKQKYFANENPQVVDGFMTTVSPEAVSQPDLTTDSVDYYFNVLTDKQVDAKIACGCANTFNKSSYYIDIDFDCEEQKVKEIYYDIYGSATLPEICNVPNEQITSIDELRLEQEGEGCED